MRIEAHWTDQAVLRELGRRVAEVRLARNLTQATVAEEAGVSKRTLERLEAGEASIQLNGLIRICRVLGLQENFNLLVPEPMISPIELMRLQGRKRQRARQRRKPQSNRVGEPATGAGFGSKAAKKWTWGDEKTKDG